METVHGTTVAIAGAGVLLRGPSASGKSDLALRLIDDGAVLVADDRTVLSCSAGTIVASAPTSIAGRIEVRGLGIVPVAAAEAAPLRLVVDLVGPDGTERMPPARRVALMGAELPLLRLAAFHASTPSKIRLALRVTADEIAR
jgi:serine kinase of HPr protein (carbohydrate metabolism regulator)